MLFPISDDDRHLNGRAVVTITLILANLALFVVQLSDPAFTYGWSMVPQEITTGEDLVNSAPLPEEDPNREISKPSQLPQRPGPGPAPLIYLTILSAMFMHGGIAHIFGNMLYLWIFGDNVEHRFGSKTFLLFYLVSGVAATFAQLALDPDSLIPNLGASGAISGVLGAYLVLFPRNRVNAIFFYTVVAVPAFVALGLWIVFQFVNGYGAIAATEQTGGVAYGAHIGGFLAGVVLAFVLRGRGVHERPNALTRADPRSRPLW
ncbi:MAG TPA: rhomboid family intramembrane serine protease [Rubricoccaceae bacterium]|nr:rhomboid family intramembrane serine protease [Rubricoccaceae bacterium]